MKSEAVKKLALLLSLALGPVSAGLAAGEKKLPEFRLNSVRISSLPNLPCGEIPPVPPPTDTGYYSRAKAGGVRLDSAVTVFIYGEEQRAEITFPRAEDEEARSGFRASLFIKYSGPGSAPALSWAAVVCSGRHYLGYKGSSLRLPDKTGDFAIKDENLSLGPLKTLLVKTHPWVLPAPGKDGFRDLDRLCSADFPGKMKAYTVKALPPEAGGFSFKYDPVKDQLTVSRKK